MPKVGHRAVKQEFKSNKYLPIIESFKEVQDSVILESGVMGGMDLYKNDIANDAMREWFISESCDPSGMGVDEFNDHVEMMGEIYDNDKEAMINSVSEATGIASMNPAIGFNMMMHKNLLVNSVFKQGIPNSVAVSPKFVETFQRQYLVKPNGERIDIALEQEKLTDAMLSTVPSVDVEIALPELATTDLIELLKGTKVDRLAIDTFISAIKIEVSNTYANAHTELQTPAPGEEKPVLFHGEGPDASKWFMWKEVKYDFVPNAYNNDFDRSVSAYVDLSGIVEPITIGAAQQVTHDILNAHIKVNGEQRVHISATTGLIKAVKLNTKVDTSLGTIETCSVDYTTEDKIFEIPAGVPLNTTITPDIVKDINALYNLNHISMIMENTMKILDNYKDDTIKKYLDGSFNRLADRYKVTGNFDMLPRQDYAFDVVEYRQKSFMDLFDSYGTKMLNILNDPDVSFSIFGRPDVVRRLTPQEYTYQSPGQVGPCTLDFTKTIYSSNKRNYSFLSSRKIKDNDLTIILKPNNGNRRKIYNLYEYCFYMGNEIRNNSNLALPSLHAYERFLMTEYQPVQGRIEILNPTGYDKAEYKGL